MTGTVSAPSTETVDRSELLPLHRAPVVRRPVRARLTDPDLLAGVAAALIGAIVIGLGIARFPALEGDEGIYTNQAWSITHGSITTYTYTYDHPFLGWAQLAPLQLVTQWLHLGGTLSVVNARAVMVGYAFAVLLLTYGIARRLGVRMPYAVLSVLALGLSPLYVVDARQVYLDNLALPWVLGAVYLALNPGRRQWTYAWAGIVLGVGVLSKETVLMFLPAVAYTVWTRAYRPIRTMSIAAFVSLGTLVVLAYPLFAALRKELFPGPGHVSLWTNGIEYQLASRKGSGAVWQPASERHALWTGWLFYDHVLLYGGVAGAVVCLACPRLRGIGLALVCWALPVLKPGGYLPAMYVIAVLPFCALAMGATLDAVQNAAARVLRDRPPGAVRARLQQRGVAVSAALALAAAALIAPQYLAPDRAVTTAPSQAVSVASRAETWVFTHTTPRDNLLVDTTFWTDLVRHGYTDPWHNAISYYQFDLDPISSHKNLPHGWQDIDYAIVSEEMRANVRNDRLLQLQAVIDHSAVVGSWGTGSERIQVLRVEPTPYNRQAGGGK